MASGIADARQIVAEAAISESANGRFRALPQRVFRPGCTVASRGIPGRTISGRWRW
jgi:hypothetical protein